MRSSWPTKCTSTSCSTARVTRAWRRHPEIAERAVVISSFGKTYHTTGWKVGYCAAPAALSAEVARVHQFVTFAVNGAIQRAYAEFVTRDPAARRPSRRSIRPSAIGSCRLIEGSRFRPLPCRGTYFQMVDYSAITDERDCDFALRLIKRARRRRDPDLAVPDRRRSGPVLRFCFAKRDDTLERAAERLRKV